MKCPVVSAKLIDNVIQAIFDTCFKIACNVITINLVLYQTNIPSYREVRKEVQDATGL